INLQVTPQELVSQVEKVSAVILMPGRLLYQPLVEAAAQRSIPCVYFNAPNEGEAQNFVSPDYVGSSEVLGRAFHAAGRKNVLFLLGEAWHLSVSAQSRLRGLLVGLQYGVTRDIRLQIDVAGGVSIDCGRAAIRRILDEGGQMPDAIYTTGDFLAVGCVEELTERGFSVPGDVSVAGGSGLELRRYSQPNLTRCAQPYEEIGNEVIAMINRLSIARTAAAPGKVVPMGWIGGATTSAEENKILMGEDRRKPA
ncbi:MAG: substrate-binding domain-containing protein, partial [Rhodospirillales bacterium]|nr:substrate-binding domain-containing protein [Acetobacter sp.]